jgi:two-component system LytT family sensor kinase
VDALRVTQERMARNSRERDMQRLAAEAELRALRAQLNPHFLFNALTTIGFLIQNAPSRAIDTLLRLTVLLRGVLRGSVTEFSTVEGEIDLVCAYLDIERARFEERLQVVIDLPKNLREVRIPTLLLQPLVENAVKHGIAPSAAGGTIWIEVSQFGERLRITIEDSGAGFDPDTPRAEGVGLRSVSDRLRAHYSDAATLRIRARPEEGTRIDIELPADAEWERRRRAG